MKDFLKRLGIVGLCLILCITIPLCFVVHSVISIVEMALLLGLAALTLVWAIVAFIIEFLFWLFVGKHIFVTIFSPIVWVMQKIFEFWPVACETTADFFLLPIEFIPFKF